MKLNDLNDDCLLMILENCATEQLLYHRTVCPRWRSLIDLLLRCKKSLYIFGTEHDFAEYCQLNQQIHKPKSYELKANSLILNQMEANSVEHLPRLLPNIRQLVIGCSSNSSHLDLPLLLSKWTKIINLTIFRCPSLSHTNYFYTDRSYLNLNCGHSRNLQLFRMYIKEIPPKLLTQLDCLGFRSWIILF